MELGRVNLRSKLLLVGADRCTTGTFFDVKYIGWLVGTAGVPANFYQKREKRRRQKEREMGEMREIWKVLSVLSPMR